MTRRIDHVVLAVRDFGAAKARFEALGFTTTPKAHHPWGTSNSLVQLGDGFIEMLSIENPDAITAPSAGEFSFGEWNRQFLDRREGMSMMVFSSEDPQLDRAQWERAGLDTYAPFEFSRIATLPGGTQATVTFSLAFVTHPGMPEAAWFVCRQHNPEHFWKPEYQRHDNGAHSIERVLLAADRPQDWCGFFAAMLPDATIEDEDGVVCVVLDGGGRVELYEPLALEERMHGTALPAAASEPESGPVFAAVTIGVRDSAAVLVAADEAGLVLRGGDGFVRLDATDGFGVALEFANRSAAG